MKHLLFLTGILALVFIVPLRVVHSQTAPSPRERLIMDFGWRFALGNANDTKRDFDHATSYFSYFAKAGYGDGPASSGFDDRPWRVVDLPHDWAVELPFDPKASYSHGFKIVGRNYPATSIGWYRKTFVIPASDLGRRISIRFDGVYRNSRVWVNGFYVGEEHSGYNPFEYDITDYLNYGSVNVVSVRVDATMEEGWFYEGAGIYRHVWLIKTSALHIAPYGVFVSFDVKKESAVVTARTTITNDGARNEGFSITQIILDADGKQVGLSEVNRLALNPGTSEEYSCRIKLAHPRLWSIDTPHLYRLLTAVHSGNSLVDRIETPFGVRTLRFDAAKGFFLNGKHLRLQGTNNHQDHAGVGIALPDALQEFRIKRLKEMGANAYRCSHNPPTPELLDVCDRLGMLVIDENRLTGTNAEHLDLLRRMIGRDRNHPSVLIWSIGNEEWAMEGNITGARVASTMQEYVRRLDPTRRVTYANSGGWGHGISTVQDVMGFNYIFNGDIDAQHRSFPDQPSMGTEETTSRGTRGTYTNNDTLNAHMMATDRTQPRGRSAEDGFAFYEARPFLSGLFFWTGFDYRGEPHPYGWPQVASQCGIVDLCGFPKDMFYFLKSWWTSAPVLHVLPHWNWKAGDSIDVWAFSNCDEVELFLNTRSLGRKAVPKNSHLEWNVAYQPGTLLARGYNNGREVITDSVETSGPPAQIRLTADRTSIGADGEDAAVVTVEVVDAEGRMVPTAGNEITFALSGPGKIIGVGNGDPSSHEPDRFFETITQQPIENLKALTVPKKNSYDETDPMYDDSGWASMTDQEGKYAVRGHDSLSRAIIRGSFTLSNLTDSTIVILWPKSLGEVQAVTINGHIVAENIKRDDPVKGYTLDHSILTNGKNVYAAIVIPLKSRFLYDNLNTDPGIVGISTPAMGWMRKTFNGLAQAIVQSKKEAGTITLTAASPGLTAGSVRIQVQPVPLRPAVSAE